MKELQGIFADVIAFAEKNGVGFGELIFGIAVLILAFRANAIIKTIGKFINQRTRILAKIARQNAAAAEKIDHKRRKLLMRQPGSEKRRVRL